MMIHFYRCLAAILNLDHVPPHVLIEAVFLTLPHQTSLVGDQQYDNSYGMDVSSIIKQVVDTTACPC